MAISSMQGYAFDTVDDSLRFYEQANKVRNWIENNIRKLGPVRLTDCVGLMRDKL